ncbi:MAG TPA: helix-turn-helix transcriptional regulator [Solirubrobacterales bacterium]|jgi:transcriptional regulator with XRE-family HTH domain|nr:helix-turn-helix transcriptional regulator [Solirubrobacterales bacterium]
MDRPSARFAANLRRLRGEADLSQEELAFRAAVHRTQVGLLEGGQRLPRFETLIKLAGALGVSPAALTEGIAWEPIEAVTGGLVVTEIGDAGDA